MCGIVGYINRETVFAEKTKFPKYFVNALMCDTVRGHHGTGILGVTEKEVNVYKKPINAFDFLELSRTKSIIDKENIFMVGHNRWATKGSHTIENSHPFTHGGVTLFHNGTLTSYHSLSKHNFDTDSEHACHLLSESDDKISALEKIEGAYSFVWYDERDQTLNFARNEERPMYIATIEGSGSVLFASESLMIEWLANRNNIKIAKISPLKEGRLLTVPLDSANKKSTLIDFKIKESVKYDYYNYGNYYSSKTTTKNNNLPANTDANKVTNIHSQNQDRKYDYLIKAASVSCTATHWEKLQSVGNTKKFFSRAPKNYGYLICRYNPTFDIKVYMNEETAVEYISKTVHVKVDSVSNRLFGYGHLLDEVVVDTKESDTALEKMTDGAYMSKKDFTKAVESGCPNCGGNIFWKDRDKVIWTGAGDAICPDCVPAFAT